MLARLLSLLPRVSFTRSTWIAFLWAVGVGWIGIVVGGYFFGLGSLDGSFASAVFQNWTGDVIFLTFIGVFLGLAQAVPPELESFERRVRILLRDKEGSQVEYAKQQLRNLGNYSTHTSISIEIREHDGVWFRLVTKSTLILHNLIDDVVTSYPVSVSDPEQDANPDGKRAHILSFTVDGEAQYSEDAGGRQETYNVEVQRDSARKVELIVESWIRDGEPISHTPQRFTQLLTLAVINRTPSAICIKMDGSASKPMRLLSHQEQPTQILAVRDHSPFTIAYTIRASREPRRTKRVAKGKRRPGGT